MQGKLVKVLQITMDENESVLFQGALNDVYMHFTGDQKRVVSEYLNTVHDTLDAEDRNGSVASHHSTQTTRKG